ncbi:MAG: hypothetical protein J6T16_03830 [Opitutales bacterium]|nr:hypothetical protein [Opitutales bacterium]
MEAETNREHGGGGHSRHDGVKVLVSLKKLGEIAESLPDPKICKERSFFAKSGSANLKFERIKYIGADGKSEYRWSYCSRIVI